jgi:hypothetical protein
LLKCWNDSKKRFFSETLLKETTKKDSTVRKLHRIHDFKVAKDSNMSKSGDFKNVFLENVIWIGRLSMKEVKELKCVLLTWC